MRFENSADAKFCSECGTALASARSRRRERKFVTVLFADLVGFTSRAEQLDPEDVQAVHALGARLRPWELRDDLGWEPPEPAATP